MASLAYGAAAAGGAFAGPTTVTLGSQASVLTGGAAYMPAIGFAVGIGAALIDSYVIMPKLRGKGRQEAAAPRLLDTPTGSNTPGAPRIWAIGGRIRVPTHIMWQDEKVRESTTNNTKAGTTISQRKVYFDAAVALNDRPCQRMQQLIGNGKLMIYSTRNILGITSNRMILTITAGPRIRLTAQTTLDPDFNNLFVVNDAVELRDWVQTAGTNINTGYFKVLAVVGHTTAASYIELGPYSGQTLTGIAATAGTAFAPATIRRVDDTLFAEGGILLTFPFLPAINTPRIEATNSTNWRIPGLFAMQDKLIIANAGGLSNGLVQRGSSNDSGFTGTFRWRQDPNQVPLATPLVQGSSAGGCVGNRF